MSAPSALTSEGGLAALRGRLLRARTCAEAIDVALAFLSSDLGLLGSVAQPLPALPAAKAAKAAQRGGATTGLEAASDALDANAWSTIVHDARSGQAWRIVVPTSAGASGAGAASAGPGGETLEAVLRDLRDAIELIATFERFGGEAVSRLRDDVARRDALLREAGNALIRDAGEVVRAVSALEQREAAINADLQQALAFQRAMLSQLPVHEQAVVDAAYLPAELISGDFYDVALLGPDRIRVLIADATGHGIAAGLATMFIKSEYEAHKRSSLGPGALLSAMNEMLTSRYSRLELRFTALCMDVFPAARKVVYSAAAHPGPVIVRTSGAEILASGGTFVGMAPGATFAEHETLVEAGDVIVGFTDGLFDAETRSGETFGEARTLDVLANARGREQACAALVRALASFVGDGKGLTDDVAVVAVTFEAPKG